MESDWEQVLISLAITCKVLITHFGIKCQGHISIKKHEELAPYPRKYSPEKLQDSISVLIILTTYSLINPEVQGVMHRPCLELDSSLDILGEGFLYKAKFDNSNQWYFQLMESGKDLMEGEG